MNFSLNKTVAALSLIAAAGAAFADTQGVTVYGRIDASVAAVELQQVRTTHLNNAGSYWGLKGVEQLGYGMRAGWVLESGFELDTGSNTDADTFFNSHSEVFVEGSLGAVRMGRFTAASYYAVADRVSLHNEDYGITADRLYRFVGDDSNRVAYRSPDMQGLVLESAMSLREQHADHHTYDLAASYDMGLISVGAGYTEQGRDKQYAVRAAWDLQPLTLAVYAQHADVDGQEVDVARVAVALQVGAGEFHANFGRAQGQGKQAAEQWTAGYNHHLSQRTKFYLLYSQIDNKHGADLVEDLNGGDEKSFSIGIRHHF